MKQTADTHRVHLLL